MFTVRFLNYAGDDLLGVVTCEAGADITSQAPTPEVFEGKTFTGWNVPITNIQEDMTVRPTYKAITYTVIFYKADNKRLFGHLCGLKMPFAPVTTPLQAEWTFG